MFTDPGLAALAAVHRRGSFDLAAASLNLTPSAVSQRIKNLEERMGTVLILRGQPCRATEAGLRLIRHFDQVSLLERALSGELAARDAGPTVLRVAVNADSLATWFIAALAATEGMLFDLVLDDERHSQTWLKRGEVAAAVVRDPGPLQGCDTVALGALRFRATASPAFVARWLATGVTADSMSRAPAVTFSDKDRLQADWLERVTSRRFTIPTHRIASSHAFVDAALAGLGWCMNPEPLVAQHLADGRLVELVPGMPLDVPLYWQFSRLTGPAIAPLTRAVVAGSRKMLLPQESGAVHGTG